MITTKRSKKAKVQILGLGDCGIIVISKLSFKNHKFKNMCVGIGTNKKIFEVNKQIRKKVLIGKGEGCLNSYDYAFNLVANNRGILEKIVKAKIIIMIANSGATSWALARYIIKEFTNNRRVFVIIQEAFLFEGYKRIAKIEELKIFVKKYPNVKVIKINPNETVEEHKWEHIGDVLIQIDFKIIKVINEIMAEILKQ